MTRCPSSRPKRRTQSGKGKSSGFKRGTRGHSWQKIITNNIHVGRKCTKCQKIIHNPRIVLLEN